MRSWRWLWLVGIMLCAPAHARSQSATFGISVKVLEQCTVQSASRSASCTGGSGYELAIAREKLPAGGRLTGIAEPAQILSSIAMPRVGGAIVEGGLVSVDRVASSTAADAPVRHASLDRATTGDAEAVRITFSF